VQIQVVEKNAQIFSEGSLENGRSRIDRVNQKVDIEREYKYIFNDIFVILHY
jgi:hypothetical protein